MKNILLCLAYDGSAYSGWQIQKNSLSIQETVQRALYDITGEEIELTASGRTDAKVHALEQVCNFKTCSKMQAHKFAYAINSKLPSDIRVISSKEVKNDFNARFFAKRKTYIYQIYNGEIYSPFYYKYSMHIIPELDIEIMKKNAAMLVGTHDFSSFYTKEKNNPKNPVRTVYNADVYRKNEIIIFEIEGNGFLYNMVRIIAGTLIEQGIGKKNMSIKEIMEKKDRAYAGATAKAHALFLKKVFYDKSSYEK